jgi:hypothetical protein
MRIVASVTLLLFASALAYAEGPKPCEELKAEIAKKVEANGAKVYTLEIVAKDKDAEGKVVGTCEGGAKKIVYSKPAAAAKTPAAAPAPAPKKP